MGERLVSRLPTRCAVIFNLFCIFIHILQDVELYFLRASTTVWVCSIGRIILSYNTVLYIRRRIKFILVKFIRIIVIRLGTSVDVWVQNVYLLYVGIWNGLWSSVCNFNFWFVTGKCCPFGSRQINLYV